MFLYSVRRLYHSQERSIIIKASSSTNAVDRLYEMTDRVAWAKYEASIHKVREEDDIVFFNGNYFVVSIYSPASHI